MARLSLDAARAVLADNFAPWVLALGITIDAVEPGRVLLSIPFDAKLCRVGGTMCGQALAAGADTAMVIALAAEMGGLRRLTTVDQSISFMRPITGADAVLDARVVRLGRTLAFATCTIAEAGGDKPAATSTGTYAILG
jgi:uncharacterized protein (TIGR00369 family)